MSRASWHNSNASFRSVSRDPEIEKEFLPHQISNTKLQEIPEEDNVSLIIDYIREEIFQLAVDRIYEGYLRKTVYSFVTNCVYEAWMRAFRVIEKNME